MRKDTFNYKITKDLVTVGKYDMPKIESFNLDNLNCKYILALPFNHALTDPDPSSKICHFYLDDYLAVRTHLPKSPTLVAFFINYEHLTNLSGGGDKFVS